jgi:hypothetical protein
MGSIVKGPDDIFAVDGIGEVVFKLEDNRVTGGGTIDFKSGQPPSRN